MPSLAVFWGQRLSVLLVLGTLPSIKPEQSLISHPMAPMSEVSMFCPDAPSVLQTVFRPVAEAHGCKCDPFADARIFVKLRLVLFRWCFSQSGSILCVLQAAFPLWLQHRDGGPVEGFQLCEKLGNQVCFPSSHNCGTGRRMLVLCWCLLRDCYGAVACLGLVTGQACWGWSQDRVLLGLVREACAVTY